MKSLSNEDILFKFQQFYLNFSVKSSQNFTIEGSVNLASKFCWKVLLIFTLKFPREGSININQERS